MYMLERAREQGLEQIHGRIDEVIVRGGRVEGVRLASDSGNETIATRGFVNAAGPLSREVGRKSGVELPPIFAAATRARCAVTNTPTVVTAIEITSECRCPLMPAPLLAAVLCRPGRAEFGG